jgi:hypothetical protein
MTILFKGLEVPNLVNKLEEGSLKDNLSSLSLFLNDMLLKSQKITFVGQYGDETIYGVKTFDSIPLLPSSAPTQDSEASNKKYVDDQVGAVGAAKNSIEVDDGDLQLVGDSAAPGSNKVYGTDADGDRGWQGVPDISSLVSGPATNTADKLPQWDGANSKTLKDGLELVTTLGNPGADTKIPTEAAVRAALGSPSSVTADELLVLLLVGALP